jgi:hypothetical protein
MRRDVTPLQVREGGVAGVGVTDHIVPGLADMSLLPYRSSPPAPVSAEAPPPILPELEDHLASL